MKVFRRSKAAIFLLFFTLLFTISFLLTVFQMKIFVGYDLLPISLFGVVISSLAIRWPHFSEKKKTGIVLFTSIASVFLFFLMLIIGPEYRSVTEPKSNRTFVAEINSSLLLRGTIQAYEQKGLILVPIEDGFYEGDISLDKPNVFILDDRIVFSFTFGQPVFSVPN